MSLVLACAFPDVAILISDSRVSCGSRKQDVLQKIYQIGPMLAIGFTSNDVRLTERILGVMTDYVFHHAKSKNTRYLLLRLPKVANYYYRKFTQGKNSIPMDFVFAGVDNSIGAVISGRALFELFKRVGSGSLSPRLSYGMYNQKGDSVTLPPPASIIAILKFPECIYEETVGLGYFASGSDAEATKHLQEAFEKTLVTVDEFSVMKHVIISSIIEEHVRKHDIETIGGLTQTVLIDEKGLKPVGYSVGGLGEDGKAEEKISMTFNNGAWVQKRLKDDKEIIVTKCPMVINSDEIFEAKIDLDP